MTQPLLSAGILDPIGMPKRFAKAMRFLTTDFEAESEHLVGSGIFSAEGDGAVGRYGHRSA